MGLDNTRNPKILVDRNIERFAITHRTVLSEKRLIWGNNEITSHVMERQRIKLEPKHKFISDELPFLATIGGEARANRISLFTSFELNMERFRQATVQGYADFNLFFDIKLAHVEEHIDRKMLMQAFGVNYGFSRADQRKSFFKIRDERFMALRELIQDHHIDDAFHLWTAERAGLDRMLTMDRRFANAFRQVETKLQTSIKVVTPKQLCDEIGKGPTDIDTLAAKFPPFHCPPFL